MPARDRGSNVPQPVPDAYRLRVDPDRDGVAQSHGGTTETEAAVKAALKWLADNQAADGRWDPPPMTPAKRPTCWVETAERRQPRRHGHDGAGAVGVSRLPAKRIATVPTAKTSAAVWSI